MDSKGVTISIPTVHVHVGPIGFHHYASKFLCAVKSCPNSEGFSPVPYYLVCRTLELGLKAYLLAKGVQERELRSMAKLGHDLVKCVNAACARNLEAIVTLPALERAEIERANAYYAKKGFEYFSPAKAFRGYKELPDLAILTTIAEKLLDGIR